MSEVNLSKLKIWIIAIRPRTLLAAVGPVIVGTAFAYQLDVFRFLPAFATLIGALLLQIAANLANDYFDFIKGYDTHDRIGPVRVSASGLLAIEELRIGLVITLIISVLIGLYLIFVGGIVILLIGFFSIIFAIAYSGGPFPLAENALGDLFVFIFFGLIAVNGTYYVQSLSFNPIVLIGSIPVGLLITAILIVNNYRDVETDKATGKTTLAVLIGPKFTRYYYLILLILSFIIPIVMIIFYNFYFWVALPFLSLPLAYKLVKTFFQYGKGPNLNATLVGTAKLSLIFSILLSIGIVLS